MAITLDKIKEMNLKKGDKIEVIFEEGCGNLLGNQFLVYFKELIEEEGKESIIYHMGKPFDEVNKVNVELKFFKKINPLYYNK